MNNISVPLAKGSRSIMEVPQQFLAGEAVPPDVEHKLGRACTAHCFSAVRAELDPSHGTDVSDLVDFVLEYGAQTGSELYSDGNGWQITKLADLLRLEGLSVISQNLRYGTEALDVRAAQQSGRVRSEFEKSRLVLYAGAGGSDRCKWLEPINNTLLFGGQVVASIRIPLLSGDGYGLHAVAIRDIDETSGMVNYFDPDYYNVARYGSSPPNIERLDEAGLIYKRPADELLSVMTGEVAHVFNRS